MQDGELVPFTSRVHGSAQNLDAAIAAHPVLECELAFGLGLPEAIVELVLGLVSLSMGSKEYLNMGNLRCGRSGGHLQTYLKHFPQENCSWGWLHIHFKCSRDIKI